MGTPAHLSRFILCVCLREKGAPVSAVDPCVVARTGQVAGLSFVPHPHQLRHACGYCAVGAPPLCHALSFHGVRHDACEPLGLPAWLPWVHSTLETSPPPAPGA
jgi:hypothetical protein